MSSEQAANVWRGFPGAPHTKVWIDGREPVRRALRLYHPGSRVGKVAKALAALCPDAVSFKILRSKPDAGTQARLQLVATAIEGRLGDRVSAVSVSPGTASRHQKMTAQVSGEDGVNAYVKVADTSAAQNLLRNEAEMLTWLADQELGLVSIPKLFALDRTIDKTLLYQGAPPEESQRRPLEPDHKDVAFLSALLKLQKKDGSLSELLAQWALEHRGEIGKDPDATWCALRDEAKVELATVFPSGRVVLSASHGDYAPWNCLDLPGGKVFVFDWEYGAKVSPLLGDLFHRVFAPSHLVRRTPPERLVRRLLMLGGDPLLGEVVAQAEISPQELPGYLLLYFFQMGHRNLAQHGAVSPYVEQCLRACLKAVRSTRRPKKVLVAAYACEPDKGSEPGVGWHMCQAISRTNQTWVITKDNNRVPIQKALAERPNPNLHVSYVGLPRWLTFWKKGGRGVRTYYYLWQFAAWREARRLGRQVEFDVAHHVTFVNDWMFSFLGLLPYPFIWGPIGSHPKIPAALAFSVRTLLADRLRYTFQSAIRLLDPLFWICALRARLIVGISQDVGAHFPLSLICRGKFVVHTAIGVEAEVVSSAQSVPARTQSRVLTIGRLVPIKGFHLAVRAFACFARTKPNATLLIIGSGPERGRLMKLVGELGISEQVEFRQWLPREEALKEMAKADLFLFPSFEGGGMVVLEAMAQGTPVVCLDYGGPGEMVRDHCGVRVTVSNTTNTVAGLASSLETLISDEKLRRHLRSGARRRVVDNYLWMQKVPTVNNWFASV